MNLLVVDDSSFMRTALRKALDGHGGLRVVATASNGQLALERLEQHNIHLVTLDLEMPIMDGIETLKEIRKRSKVPIIVLSAVTPRGGELALEALSLGADEVLAKPGGQDFNLENSEEKIRDYLLPRILQFQAGLEHPDGPVPRGPVEAQVGPLLNNKILNIRPSALVIASSTGGPKALEDLFKDLVEDLEYPVFIAQHMPAHFTKSLADRLTKVSGLDVREAIQGDRIEDGRVYIAPGDHHLTIIRDSHGCILNLNQGPRIHGVRPAADLLFQSAAKAYGASLLAFVLTGMGEDGCQGSMDVKASGGVVAIQSRESCVVFGMPGAVQKQGSYDYEGSIDSLRAILRPSSPQKQTRKQVV